MSGHANTRKCRKSNWDAIIGIPGEAIGKQGEKPVLPSEIGVNWPWRWAVGISGEKPTQPSESRVNSTGKKVKLSVSRVRTSATQVKLSVSRVKAKKVSARYYWVISTTSEPLTKLTNLIENNKTTVLLFELLNCLKDFSRFYCIAESKQRLFIGKQGETARAIGTLLACCRKPG
ncbi:MAG: hypothetical protein GY847_11820 [Proteobacteria bacterium]|nr:hypothetical protein [Pseudomonadota bacterium]